jgi:hypothetical protein
MWAGKKEFFNVTYKLIMIYFHGHQNLKKLLGKEEFDLMIGNAVQMLFLFLSSTQT